MKEKKKRWRTYGIFAIMLIAAYFINVEVQSYLGRRALSESGLNPLSLEAAFLEARETSKLVLADLSAIWCPNCRTFDKQVLSHPAVQRVIDKRYVFARIEYESEEGKAFQKKYGVSGFPNLLILDPEGRMIQKLKLVSKPTQFAAQLESL